MCKRCAGETGAAEARAATHGADMHPASHAVHPACKAAAVHAAHPTAVPAATPKTAASEHRWRKRQRRSERTGDEATKELLVHPDSSWSSCIDGYHRRKATGAVGKGNDQQTETMR